MRPRGSGQRGRQGSERDGARQYDHRGELFHIASPFVVDVLPHCPDGDRSSGGKSGIAIVCQVLPQRSRGRGLDREKAGGSLPPAYIASVGREAARGRKRLREIHRGKRRGGTDRPQGLDAGLASYGLCSGPRTDAHSDDTSIDTLSAARALIWACGIWENVAPNRAWHCPGAQCQVWLILVSRSLKCATCSECGHLNRHTRRDLRKTNRSNHCDNDARDRDHRSVLKIMTYL
jgi:hypothetical protein